MPLNRDLVYLTNCYPIYFGDIASANLEAESIIIFEIDMDELDEKSTAG